jgi:molybdopterin converting factor small subunit
LFGGKRGLFPIIGCCVEKRSQIDLLYYMELTIQAFGIAKDILGDRKTSLSINDGATVADLLALLNQEYPAFQKLTSLAVALNEEYAEKEAVLSPADTIVLVPPVSGG